MSTNEHTLSIIMEREIRLGFSKKKEKKRKNLKTKMQQEQLPLCNEHITIIALTGKEWCGLCKQVEPELQKLHKTQGTTFHFVQFDDSDPTNKYWFEQFKVSGVPCILIFDPQTKFFTKFQYERTAAKIQACAERKQECKGDKWDSNPPFQLAEHAFTLCNTCRSVLIFTSMEDCPHCRTIAPQIEALKQNKNNLQVLHYDLKDNTPIADQFHIQEFPTVLVFDPNTKLFQRFMDVKNLTDIAKINSTKLVPWDKNHIPKKIHLSSVACTKCNTSMMKAACGSSQEEMQAPCPKMEAACGSSKEMYTAATPNMEQEEQEQQQQHCFVALSQVPQLEFMPMEFCGSCPTILMFTGQEWCDPCRTFQSQVQQLLETAQCGSHHAVQYDVKQTIPQDDPVAMVAFRYKELFGIEEFPTILIFQPQQRQFYNYTGVRSAVALARCDVSRSNPWPTPANLRVSLRQQKTHITQLKVSVTAQTNGRLNLCKKCPTLIVFALRQDTYAHLLAADGKGMHVLHFNARQHGTVLQLFQINVFPTMLLFDPQMHVFFVYEGTAYNMNAMLSAYNNRTLKKTWNIHPQIVLTE